MRSVNSPRITPNFGAIHECTNFPAPGHGGSSIVAGPSAAGQSQASTMEAGVNTASIAEGGCSTATGPRSAAGTLSLGPAESDFANAESSGVIS